MRIFPDTGVLLAGSASPGGASRNILDKAGQNGWVLITTPYVIHEVVRNLPDFPPEATAYWTGVQTSLSIRGDIFTLDRPTFFNVSKDRPILYGALAWADVLLTLDRSDFGKLLGTAFYNLRVLKPGEFLEEERLTGRLI
jgi:predicted nucleic acid-binding protein